MIPSAAVQQTDSQHGGDQPAGVPDVLVGAVSLTQLGAEQHISLAEEVADALIAADGRAARVRDLSGRLESLFHDATGTRSRLSLFALDPLDGTVVASVNPDDVFVAASTYKLFVAYSMIFEVEEGRADWSDRLLGRQSIGECMEIMITESDNACAEAWLRKVGPDAVQKEVEALGLGHTRVAWSKMETTAKDLVLFLDMLLEDDIVLPVDRDLLLGHMRTQMFRDGVPEGVGRGIPVADKVGFLDSYLHDAAIIEDVEHPLLLVILTSGASWGTIAELSDEVFSSFAGPSGFPGLLE